MSKVRNHVLDFGHWTLDFGLVLEALSEEIRHLDEERAPVAAEAGDDLAANRVEAVIQIVIVAGVEGCTGVRRPTQEELSTHALVQRVVINDGAREGERSELVR